MTPRATGAPKEDRTLPWKETIGRHPHNVQIVERTEKGLAIFLRYKDPDLVRSGARDARAWKATGLQARDALGERFNENVRAQARVLANALELDLRNGKVDARVEPPASAMVEEPATLADLSIRDGIAMAITLDGTGMLSVPLVDGERAPDRTTKELISRSKTMRRIWEQHPDHAGLLPKTWNSFTSVDADYVVRTLADEHVSTGRHGFTVAQKMLDEFYRTARWLKEKRAIADDACKPREKWKVHARKVWVKIVGELDNPDRPRHSQPELRAIFSALDDPRGLLALSFHHEARLSLFADRTWSDFLLERTAMRPHGGVRVREAEGNEYVRRLTSEQRTLIDEAMLTGYLRRYEAARLKGEIEDYHIFSAGRLVILPGEAAELGAALMVDAHAAPLIITEKNALTIDPRCRLAVEIGAPLRLGQVYLTRRSQVDMDAMYFLTDDPDAMGESVGIVDVRGRGNKQSPGLALNGVTRQAFKRAFAGYLSAFEALYRAGEIEDYQLFPAGRLVMGVAKPTGKYSRMPATRDAALGWFHDLEVIAGIQVVKGRGWNGLRRVLMDTAPRYTGNESTLNTMAGTSTAMRNGVYQDRESLESKVDAANTLERIRTNGRTAGTTPTPNPLLINPDLAKQLSLYSADEIRAMIALMDADRAARSATSIAAKSVTNPDENGVSVDPAVDPNEEARVHDVDPGLWSANRAT